MTSDGPRYPEYPEQDPDGGPDKPPPPPEGSPPPPPPNPWQAPAYGQPGVPVASATNQKATWALILGILGPFCCGIFTAIPALILGIMARKEIDASGGTPDGPGDGDRRNHSRHRRDRDLHTLCRLLGVHRHDAGVPGGIPGRLRRRCGVTSNVTPRSTTELMRDPALVGVAGAGALVLLHLRDPHESGSYGFCPFLAVTGHPCPGCGGLRAVNELTHGNIVDALSSNLLAVGLLALLTVVWAAWFAGEPEGRTTRCWSSATEPSCSSCRGARLRRGSQHPVGCLARALTSGRDGLTPEPAVRVRTGQGDDRVGHNEPTKARSRPRSAPGR